MTNEHLEKYPTSPNIKKMKIKATIHTHTHTHTHTHINMHTHSHSGILLNHRKRMKSIPGLGRSPGKGKGYPLQCSGLKNSMDCIVHGVAKSQT